MMDFSQHAGAASPFDLIPKGQLAWANLTIRGVKGSASGGQYIDAELTIDQGQPFAGRKIFEKIGDPMHQGNSEKYRQMGSIAITRILEAGRGASPQNPAGYQLTGYEQLSGLRVPVKIGVEPGKDGHEDKNRIAEFLTPNPASQSGHKDFVNLNNGVFNTTAQPKSEGGQGGFGGGASSVAASATGGFGGGGFGNQPAAQSTGFGSGNTQSGFQQAPAGQPAGHVETAGETSSPAAASPSNPGQTPGWLAQASGQ